MTRDEFMRRADDAAYMGDSSLLKGDVDALFEELARLRAERDEARAEVEACEDWQDKLEALRASDLARAEAVEREWDAALSQVKAWQEEELARRAERDAARAEVARLREALRRIAEGVVVPITGDMDDPSAKQLDGYFRGYAMAVLEKKTWG